MDIFETRRLEILDEIRDSEGSFPKSESELSKKDLEKIASHANRFGHSEDEVKASILANAVAYRVIVGKNPSRMDYYEKALVAYLDALPSVKRAVRLPKKGKNSYHIKNGTLVQGKKTSGLKSLDILVELVNGEKIWIIHKYTGDDGGSQSSAETDALLTVKASKKSKNGSQINIAAILDGPYYQRKVGRGSVTRLEAAKKRYPHAMIGTYNDFEELTEKLSNPSVEPDSE